MIRKGTCIALLLVSQIASGMNLAFDPIKEPQKAQQMYLAPESFLFYRLRFPNGQAMLLEKNFAKPGTLAGAGGWSGSIQGSNAVLRTPKTTPGGSAALVFKDGIPTTASRGKTARNLKNEAPLRLPYDESPLFECMSERPPASDNPDGYWQDGRLTFPYGNPNQSALLYAGLGILALWLILKPHKAAWITGGAISLLCLALLFWTASRGGLLAFIFGAGSVCILRFRRFFKLKSVWIGLAVLFMTIGIWFSVAPPKLVTRGSGEGANGWSNRVRLELWRAAPKMMVDAPGGWQITPPGPAYVDWYQPFGNIFYSGTLMNDHLTRMASCGWPLRFGYAFAWFLVLSLTGWFALTTKNAVPFGSWAAIAIASWFNPVTVGKWSFFVWLPAIAATLALIMSRTWLRRKPVIACTLLSTVAATLSVMGIYSLGQSGLQQVPAIHTEGRRVMIGGKMPSIWVVDDGFALGGLMFARDIRDYYRKNPRSRPIGYVKSVDDLPPSGVRRLVLAGRAGDAFLRKTCSSAAGPQGLPPELVFLSPPFPPMAIPQAVWKYSTVTMYLGEFATWYSPEYDQLPQWVKRVPGTVRYFPKWMHYALGEQQQEPTRHQFL